MGKNEKKYIQILTKKTELPMLIRSYADEAYSIILAGESEKIKEKQPDTTRKLHKKRFVLLVAVAVLIFGTTAYAAVRNWRLTDFFTKGGKELPNQATALIETEVVQDSAESDLVNFKIREAVCDNQTIYVVLEARPVNPEKYLLLAIDAYYNDPAENMGISTEKGKSLAEYAAENNKQMLHVSPYLSNNGTGILFSADYTTEEDGTVVFILKGENISNLENMTLTCNTTVNTIDMDGKYGEAINNSFDFKLSNKSSEETECYQQADPTVVENTGVIVDKIDLSKTELGVYTELTFHIVPDATKEQITLAKDGLWFEYLDEDGNVWESGLSGIGLVDEIKDGVFVQKNNFKDMELPEDITVRAYNCWEKTRYGMITTNKK